MSTKPKVVWWSNMPTPYFVERFNALADRGNLEFEAWFNRDREPDRSWELQPSTWRFHSRRIPERILAEWKFHLPLSELLETRPDLLVQEYDRAQLAIGALAALACARRTTFRILRPPAWCQKTLAGFWGRHFLFRSIDGAKISGTDAAKFAEQYGLSRQRMRVVTQSIDVAHYASARKMSADERAKRRCELGVDGCVFVYVGRLISGKGLEYLFKAFRQVEINGISASLLLIGDGVEETHYRNMVADLAQVRFVGYVQSPSLPQWYAIADVMVFPTLGDSHGLVIDEALAAGLPVICTEAAGEIYDRLPNGRAGYIVPAASESRLAEQMMRLATDVELRRRFAQEAPTLVENITHTRYAEDFEAFVDAILALPPRRTLASQGARLVGAAMLKLASYNSR